MPKKIIICNLSSVFDSDIKKGKQAFADLYDKYAAPACSSCCPGLFTKLSNDAKVAIKLTWYKNDFIEPYRLGKIDTETFLNKAVQVFNFLEKYDYDDTVVAYLNAHKTRYFSLKDSPDLSRANKKLIAKAIIEDAWNGIYSFNNIDFQKFEHFLVKTYEDHDIYFISNSNPLNIHRILYELKQIRNDFKEESIQTSQGDMLQVADNIYMVLSYLYQAYKAESDYPPANKIGKGGTPALLGMLLYNLRQQYSELSMSDIVVITQYKKDLEEAKKLGISENNRIDAATYYEKNIPKTANNQENITEQTMLLNRV